MLRPNQSPKERSPLHRHVHTRLPRQRRKSSEHRGDASADDESDGEGGLEQTLFAESPQNLENASERCAAHPGSRNELWCEGCMEAICSHCAGSTKHQSHAVVKLSAAYDDTFEEVEAMQIKLVRRLTETRQRNALLDESLANLVSSLEQAQQALDEQLGRDIGAIEKEFERHQEKLQTEIDECAEWRGGLEETLNTVQMMVEEFTPAQLVTRRRRILGLLGAVERARPAKWWSWKQPPTAGLAEMAQPPWHYTTLYVPRVLELGRRRGHVRVISDPFSAHGMVWQVEARRSRGELGDSCLAVVATCVEGCQSPAFTVSVHVAAAEDPEADGMVTPRDDSKRIAGARKALQAATEQETQRHFVQERRSHAWQTQPACEFVLCTLGELQGADVLDSGGGVTVRVGVQPESFRELARVQQERIRVLEQRQLDASGNGSGLAELGSMRPSRRRRESNDDYGWATSPRMAQRMEPVRMRQVAEPALPRIPQSPQSIQSQFTFTADSTRHNRYHSQPTGRCASSSSSNDSQAASPTPATKFIPSSAPEPNTRLDLSGRDRSRTESLAQRLRKQAPVPFPLGAIRAQSAQPFTMPAAIESQASVHAQSDAGDRSGMLRRLSGWVRTTEGRVAQQARRVRQQLSSSPEAQDTPKLDAIDDWTFLDMALSPTSPHASDSAPVSLAMQMAAGAAVSAGAPTSTKYQSPPGIPLPPLPNTSKLGDQGPASYDSGFSFDGVADIEREQAKVDARAATISARSQQQRGKPAHSTEGEGKLRARYDSLVERIDALQLIANTVENSRDGFTEGTLRRISSELGVLMDSRRRRFAEARALSSVITSPEHLDMGLDERKRCLIRPQTTDGRRSISVGQAELQRATASLLSSANTHRQLAMDSPDDPLTACDVGLQDAPGASTESNASIEGFGGVLNARLSEHNSPTRSQAPLSDTTPTDGDKAAALDRINVRTPQGPGRFAEYVAATPPPAAASAGSFVGKSGRSTTLPPLAARYPGSSSSIVASRLPDISATTPTRDNAASRQVRSARALRKRVRFPEEQRMLETIRLIDPSVAQSIESHAAKSAAAAAAASAATSPVSTRTTSARLSPPRLNLARRLSGGSISSGSDDELQRDGLAAKVRSSPRLSPKRLLDENNKPEDDAFTNSPASSEEKFGTASSQMFDDAVKQPLMLLDDDSEDSIDNPTKRAPAPPRLQLTSSDRLSASARKNSGCNAPVRCRSTAIFDHSVLSPTLADMAGNHDTGAHAVSAFECTEESDGGVSSQYEDALDSVSRLQGSTTESHGLGIATTTLQDSSDFSMNAPLKNGAAGTQQKQILSERINSRGLAVGPNSVSSQSSPASFTHTLGSANCSSSSSPPTLEHTLLHTSDASVFDDASARPRNARLAFQL
ncbi:Tripartite motif containing 37 [Coemansia guatemalensis]|uniref:Tripartite motif containing 37 n=1 Tax=Coemansia guatemalensis TaxID=2761395 RepID=A0A9W8HZ20_9FUNG|nr:Tripartite motif containing 37 [Coemansia guatemalensis]